MDIPRFSVAADSGNFASVSNVISYVSSTTGWRLVAHMSSIRNLLLYSDPGQKRRNEELEKFVYRYDFSDRQSAAGVVANMQRHLRQLQLSRENYQLNSDTLDYDGRLDLMSIKSQLFSLATELNLIFEAIAHAQAKAENADGQQSFAFVASSSEISWNMLDNDNLLAKLSLRGLKYSWITATNGSMTNSLRMNDVQALDGAPNALFSEMLVKHEGAGSSVSDHKPCSTWK